MPSVIYEGQRYELEPGETVLEALLRQQVQVPNSCRAGVCQSCLMRAVGGAVPEKAQAGLKDTMKARGYFLACSCHPEGDLEIKKAGADVQVPGTIAGLERLSPSVVRVKVRCERA
jgi:CDP-4-dehydro-6-deoxyglucose reductase, E3